MSDIGRCQSTTGSAAAPRNPASPTTCEVWRARRSWAARMDRRRSAMSQLCLGLGSAAMQALVTGATGKVGNAVARALIARADRARVRVRDPERARRVLPDGVEPVRGDVTEPASLRPACEGCDVVFNAMGLPEQWLADEGMFEQVNARGTENVVRAAREAGVRRMVHTSTIDVFHAERGQRFDEHQLATYKKGTAYERSKQHAEELALGARDGMELVMVNPAGVYGPGPLGSASLERAFSGPPGGEPRPPRPPG